MKNLKINILKVSAILFLVFQPLALAGQYDIKEMTPQVKQALSDRKSRYEQLQSAKAAGQIGESREGFVFALKGGAELASAENADRKVIYQAIVDQNGFGSDGLGQVQKIFADVQHEKARPGDYIQTSSGKWQQK